MDVKKFKRSKVLDTEGNVLLKAEIDFDADTKTIVDFCVMLILQKEDAIHVVVKYDAAHGNNHVHRYYERLNSFGEEVLPKVVSARSVRLFKDDLIDNWKEYVRLYLCKWFK
ncbi:MAG: hypothetical protein AABW59_03120 [archaeon]